MVIGYNTGKDKKPDIMGVGITSITQDWDVEYEKIGSGLFRKREYIEKENKVDLVRETLLGVNELQPYLDSLNILRKIESGNKYRKHNK